jgi:dihydrodipicolinate synthase/N-acetylneuraminate lyase
MITRRSFSKSAAMASAALLGSRAIASLPGLSASTSYLSELAPKSAAASVRGFIGTPVTPFKPDETLDGDTYQKIVDFLVRKGAQALASPMHIGEALSMSSEERKQLARLAVEAVNGRVPVFIHCSLPGTRETVALAQHAQSIGAQGIVVVTPYFYHLANAPLLDHFVSVAKSIDISVIVYHNASVGELPLEVLTELIQRSPNVIGLKEGSHEMGFFTQACRLSSALRPGFAVFDGVENVATTIPVGGSGCFSPISDLAPVLVRSLIDASMANDYEKARALQWKVTELEGILAKYGGFAGLASAKPARAMMGRSCGIPRKPLPALDKETVSKLEADLTNSGVLANEPTGWA